MENIIEELRYFNKKFPRQTIEQVVKLKEEMTPVLLEELDKVIENPKLATEDPDYMMHIYAMFLLAQFREEQAFSRMIDLMYFSPEETDRIFGDILTEDLGSILYSTFDGDFVSLKSVIENPLLNIYARGAALDMYGKLYADGLVAKEEVINYLRELLSENSGYDEADIATSVHMLITTRKIFEMTDDVQKLYDDYRIEEGMVGSYDDFVDWLYLYHYSREPVHYIEDTIKEMSGWASFELTKAQKLEQEKRRKELEKEYEKEVRAERLAAQTATKKVGRNDPCPCGSGKKYKKCHMKIDQAAKNSYLETAEEQKEWLKYYPEMDGDRQENERRITDDFDDEAIEIDRLVYLALHHRSIPMWTKRDYQKENRTKIAYLIQALEKFNEKRSAENIDSFKEYDRHYKIHYRSLKWVGRLRLFIEENELESKYEETYENVKQTLKEMK